MKRLLLDFKIILVFLLVFVFQLQAQQINQMRSPVHSTKLELKLTGDMQANNPVKIDNALTGYEEKIISHEYSAETNRLFVFISDKTDPIDVLQILKMNGIKAGYRDEDNGYVTLEADGRTTRKLYYKD